MSSITINMKLSRIFILATSVMTLTAQAASSGIDTGLPFDNSVSANAGIYYASSLNPLELTSVLPKPDAVVDFKEYPDLQVIFNQDIEIDRPLVTIRFSNALTGKEESVETPASANRRRLLVTISSTLSPLMGSSALRPGDDYEVVIEGVKSTAGEPYHDTDTDGPLILHFTCGTMPVLAIEEYIPDPFLSYWAPGAPEGILTMDFDAPLMDDGKTWVALGWGNLESDGKYYHEKIICDIDGKRLSADLTGKLRTPALMTPQYPDSDFNTIVISVMNVRDHYGDYVASPGQGTLGSYHYLLPYVLINRTSLVAEFTPQNGSPIDEAGNVNVWMTGLQACSFEGFTLTVTHKDNTETKISIPLSEVKVTPIDENECEYDFTIPEETRRDAKRIMISLSGVKSLDGYDHEHEVKCIYGGMIVNDVSPANGEKISILKEGTEISMRANLSEKFPNLYVECRISDMGNDPENDLLLEDTPMTRRENGSYTLVNPTDLKLYDGHDYIVEFTGWIDEQSRISDPANSLGTDFAVWKGGAAAYHYSGITLAKVTPAPETPINEDLNEIILEFNGSVGLGNGNPSDGDLLTYILSETGEKVPFTAIEPMDLFEHEGMKLSNAWRLVIPDEYMATLTTPLAICFTAYDQDKMIVCGNRGKEEKSYFCLTWPQKGSSGVSVLEEENMVTVYDTNGVLVTQGIYRDIVKKLNKGLYIINGRKVIKK